MSGAGGVIIRSAVAVALKNPLISGRLPEHMRTKLQSFVDNDPATWSEDQEWFVKTCFDFCWHECQ